MSFYPFEFEAPVSRHSMGTNSRGELFYTVIYVPPHILADMGEAYHPKIRVEGEVADLPFSAALMPSRGQVYLMAPKALLKQIDEGAGELLNVRFKIADQDAVDVPPALADALERRADAAEAWEVLTPGKRRGLAYRVGTAKTAPTIAKRIKEVFDALGVPA